MKKLIIAFLLTLTMAVTAYADDGLYYSGNIGLNSLESTNNVDFSAGYGMMGAVGYDTGNHLRTEFEIGYRSNNVTSLGTLRATGTSSALSFMANGYYDLALGYFRPYIGGGLGLGMVSADVTSLGVQAVDDSDIGMAYQFIAGAAYPVYGNINMTLEYRYMGVTGLDMGTIAGPASVGYDTHNLLVGARVNF